MTLRFSVSDTGIGLSQDLFEKIFQPFTQGDSSITRKYGGTGLGLAISRQLVEQMGGTIVPENNPGGGAMFHVTLPFPLAGAAPQSARQQNAPGENPQTQSRTDSCRILLAEDDPTNRTLMVLLLEKMGHQVTAVETGREAVDFVTGTPLDLILMDVSMPELDGLSATRQIRALPGDNPNVAIPIIALTAHARQEDHKAFLEAGMSEVLAKPFTIENLRTSGSDSPTAGAGSQRSVNDLPWAGCEHSGNR